MPWSLREYRTRWISNASDAASLSLACCLRQYCITMAMLAAPHPSLSCLIKGTSSHTPGVAEKTKPQKHRIQMSLCGKRAMKTVLADSHNNQHQHRDAENNQDQITFAEIAGIKISLRFVSSRRQLGQFLIVKG